METVLLPAMLKRYGYSSEEALSIYGVLTGMTFSFLLFPSTITNSLAVLLVPSVAEADAAEDTRMIRRSISLSIRYCLLLGILCTGIFMVFGKELGLVIFHNELAGDMCFFHSIDNTGKSRSKIQDLLIRSDIFTRIRKGSTPGGLTGSRQERRTRGGGSTTSVSQKV